MKNVQKGFTLIELMIVVAIIGILASIAIPAYQDYMTRSKWAKAVAEIGAIKLAISECLNDNSGDGNVCDDTATSGAELQKYGIASLPPANDDRDILAISNVGAKSVAVVLTGFAPLAECKLTMVATPTTNGLIVWKPFMESGGALADGAKCASFVKGAKAEAPSENLDAAS
jgi:type IV pilus assembly protein PilA